MLANGLANHLGRVFNVIKAIWYPLKTLKHAVDRHIIGMIWCKLETKFIAKMLEKMHFIFVVAMH